MIFHSTKGLTQPHEFKFNIHKKDKIEESDGEGEIKDDEESHVILLFIFDLVNLI